MATQVFGLKQRRQELNMTQAEVAKAAGISQPTYQNYEAGTMTIPPANLKKLARALKMRGEEILGRAKSEPVPVPKIPDRPVDKVGGDDDGESHVVLPPYWGDIAIHFALGNPIVLPIGPSEYRRLWLQLQEGSKFFAVRSLSNQIVAVRRAAVTDLCLSHDAVGTHGPEQEAYHDLGVIADVWPAADHYWDIVEQIVVDLKSRPELVAEYGEHNVMAVERHIGNNIEEDIDNLVAERNRKLGERDAILAAPRRKFDEAERLALKIRWQLSSGKQRETEIDQDSDLSMFWWVDGSDPESTIIVQGEDMQSYFINPDALDYISIPARKYERAEAEEMKRFELITKQRAKKKSIQP